MTKYYDKLVRDKIPKLIEEDGRECSYEIAEGEDYQRYITRKLMEEVSEFLREPSNEEMGDILEVLDYFIINNDNLDYKKVKAIKRRKSIDKGKFNDGIILKQVD